MRVAVIPARAGSKRIPGKNMRPFCGQPIIQYSIQAALQAAVFDRVIVSTDSDQIAELAIAAGADVPFRRPAELADDFTPTLPVIRHAINAVNTTADPIEFCCCLYPTAPFVTVSDLLLGLEKLQQHPAAEFAFPITTFSYPIFRSLQFDGDTLEMFFPEYENTRSQDLPEAWHDAGQFYWGTARAWQEATGIFSSASVGIRIPRYRVQDIDTLEDWVRAEAMFRALAM